MVTILLVVGLFVRVPGADANCVEWSLWAFDAFPYHVSRDEPDSVRQVLADWRVACGSVEPLVRSEILAAIWDGRFDAATLPPGMLDLMIDYQLDQEETAAARDAGAGDPGTAGDPDDAAEPGPYARFTAFTEEMAAQLVPYTDPGTTEDLLVRFYAGEFEETWRRLGTPAYEGTPLREAYERERRRLSGSRARSSLGFHAGLWSGTGELDGGRLRGLLGAQFGGEFENVWLWVLGELRVGGLGRGYLVREDDTLQLADGFSGLSLLLELRPRLWRWRALEFGLAAGVGWSGVESLPAEQENDVPALWIHAFPRTVGADLRIWRDHGRFAEFQLRREWADWDTGSGGSDLDGGSWNLRLVVGFDREPERDRRRALGVGEPD